MRKIIVLALCWAMSAPVTHALPGHITAEISPSCSINKVYYTLPPPIRSQGSAMRIHFGAAYHFPLKDYCSISTGLSYALGHIGLQRSVDQAASIPAIDEMHFVQSIWVPVLCRLYTNEIMIDTSIYIKIGLIPAINLSSRLMRPLKSVGSRSFVTLRRLAVFMLLGGGIKYDFSLANSLSVGLSYCWDLAGIMYKNDVNNGEIYCHNNFACLDFCFLF